MNDFSAFHGPNAGYVLELYDRYRADPQSVDAETRAFFQQWPPPAEHAPPVPQSASNGTQRGAHYHTHRASYYGADNSARGQTCYYAAAHQYGLCLTLCLVGG